MEQASARAPEPDQRQRFEDAIYAEHFLKAVKIDPNRQFWDLSAQKEKAELFVRDGEDYADASISAMWFGWQKRGAQDGIVALPEQAGALTEAQVEAAYEAFRPKDRHWSFDEMVAFRAGDVRNAARRVLAALDEADGEEPVLSMADVRAVCAAIAKDATT